MNIKIVEGDLLKQPVECIVNSWNRNYIPWFLLWSYGVSRNLQKQAGYRPFLELAKQGLLEEGAAVITSGGKMPFKIIHVAALTWYWTTNHKLIRRCVKNALKLAQTHGVKSIAFPLVGSGLGGIPKDEILDIIKEVSLTRDWGIEIIVVKFK